MSVDWLSQYRTMLIIRRFEQYGEQLFTEGRIRGTMHPCTGQEAVAVGSCSALAQDDYVTSTHRGHGHFIAKGGDPRRMMAELFGKATGYSGGRGGSQLMADYDIGFLGANGITGGSLPTAVGAALTAKYKRTGRVALCFFGDGAANQGTCHESMNLAALWSLPVIFLCENNRYAMSTATEDALPVRDIADRAAGYGIEGETVDGNDIEAVYYAVSRARERARNLEGPTLVECKTYRLSGHSRGDKRHYRSSEEEERAWRNEPILRTSQWLQNCGVLSEQQDTDLQAEAAELIDEAVRFAEESAEADPAELEQGVYA